MDESQTVLEIYKKGHEAADKFDYFVCTVAGAIFAYDAEHYTPKHFGFDFYLLEPISLLLLAMAFVFGLKRIESVRTTTLLNHNMVDCTLRAKELSQMLENQVPIRNYAGQLRDPAEVRRERQSFVDDVKKYSAMNRVEMLRAGKFQRLRDLFLIAGFAAIFLAKVLKPYAADAYSDANATNQLVRLQSQRTPMSATQNLFQLAPVSQTTNRIKQP